MRAAALCVIRARSLRFSGQKGVAHRKRWARPDEHGREAARLDIGEVRLREGSAKTVVLHPSVFAAVCKWM